eukprot:4131278-Pleurochrysis_carterae.AAC.3
MSAAVIGRAKRTQPSSRMKDLSRIDHPVKRTQYIVQVVALRKCMVIPSAAASGCIVALDCLHASTKSAQLSSTCSSPLPSEAPVPSG